MGTVDMNTEVAVPILFDGYICVRTNFTATTGYALVTITNENGVTIFVNQVNCGPNASYAYETGFVPVKAGWSIKATGSNIQALKYKFTHV